MQYVKPNGVGAVPNHVELFAHHPDFLDIQPVSIRNARDKDQDFFLSRNGFQYSKFTAAEDVDYMDKHQVTEKYLPALEQFVKLQYV